jgi:hypothetical protein
MSRTIFIGDSHSAGYVKDLGSDVPTFWNENNYAEIYSKLNSIESAIYALPGGCNRKYPVWVSYLLDEYNVDRIFLQSTYWNRYLIAHDGNLDLGESLTKDHFVKRFDDTADGSVHRYTDMFFNEKRFELMVGTYEELWTQFEGFKFAFDDPSSHYEIFEKKYKYTKLWHEALTHLQLRDYLSDLIVIDHMAMEKDIPVYVWNINNRVHIPQNKNLFGKFKKIKFAKKSAEDYLLEKHKMKIEKMQLDGEHYNMEVHEAIAEHYIPWIEKENE